MKERKEASQGGDLGALGPPPLAAPLTPSLASAERGRRAEVDQSAKNWHVRSDIDILRNIAVITACLRRKTSEAVLGENQELTADKNVEKAGVGGSFRFLFWRTTGRRR